MWYLVSLILFVVGSFLCYIGELWAVVLYLPFIVLWLANDVEQERQRDRE